MSPWRRILTILLALAILGTPARLPAPEDTQTSTAPSAAHPMVEFLAGTVALLAAYHDPQSWVAYSAIATALYYNRLFSPSLDYARGTRQVFMRNVEVSRLSREEKEKLIAEMDQHIKVLSENIPRANESLKLLDAMLRKFVRKSGDKKTHLFPGGLNDFAKFLAWKESAEGEKYFNDHPLLSVNYQWHLMNMTGDIYGPLSKVIELHNKLQPGAQESLIVPRDYTAGSHLPGQFERQSPLISDRTSVGLGEILPFVENLRARCKGPLLAAADDEKIWAKEGNWPHFWNQWRHVKWPLAHGGVVLGGVGLTTYLWTAYDYERTRADQARSKKQDDDASSDFAGWISSPEGRQYMAPFYGMIRMSLRENRDGIINMLKANLTADEQKNENLQKRVDELINSPALIVALEPVVIASAKSKQGERLSPKSFQTLLENAKTDPNIRAGLFRPFMKEIYKGTVNNLWADLTVGNPSDIFDKNVMRTLMDRTDELLSGDKKITAPPAKDVPAAPGVNPPTATNNESKPKPGEPAAPTNLHSSNLQPGMDAVASATTKTPLVDPLGLPPPPPTTNIGAGGGK